MTLHVLLDGTSHVGSKSCICTTICTYCQGPAPDVTYLGMSCHGNCLVDDALAKGVELERLDFALRH